MQQADLNIFQSLNTLSNHGWQALENISVRPAQVLKLILHKETPKSISRINQKKFQESQIEQNKTNLESINKTRLLLCTKSYVKLNNNKPQLGFIKN